MDKIPGISETLINKHEESAELFFTAILILGAISLATVFLEIKKSKFAKSGFILVMVLSLVSGVLAKYVGTSGGEIRHTEIRNDAGLIQLPSEKADDDD